MNILLIEDNQDLREVIRDLLKGEGFSIYEAENGKMGFEILSKTEIHLIISDIDMPIMTGIEFIRRARAFFKNTPPIYIMTGAGRYSREQCLAEGATDYFEKGMHLNLLIDVIRNRFNHTP